MFEKVKSIRMAFCLIAISFLVLCGFVTTRDEKYVAYFLHLYSAGLFREQNFTLHDAKATFGKDHIHRIEMSLSCYKALPLENARKLVTSLAMDFLERINNDPGLKEKGLIKEKFIPRQLHLRIMCDNVFGETYDTIFIREIILDRGQLTYTTFKNMPEFWGKSYTIHEDFDYALMLTGAARHPEDVIEETRIVPQMRAMPGDTSDSPVRMHEELLYPSKAVQKELLEPKEAAVPPLVPLAVVVEEFSQLNVPPPKEPEVDEPATVKQVESVPPEPVPTTAAPDAVTPAAQKEEELPQPELKAPVQTEKPVEPNTTLTPILEPVNPPESTSKDAQQEPKQDKEPEQKLEQEQKAAPAPSASEPVLLPPAAASTTQMPERLKQAESEGQKLLSRNDNDNYVEKDKVPTLPETQIAENEDALTENQTPVDNQIDLFGLFDSFTSSFTAKAPESEPEEVAAMADVVPEDNSNVIPKDNSTPPDEDFEMPEYEYGTPQKIAQEVPQAAVQSSLLQITENIVVDNDIQIDEPSEDKEPLVPKDNSTPPDEDFEMPEYEYSKPPEEVALVEDDVPATGQIVVVEEVESTEVVEEVQGQAEPTKSWWQSLFAPKDEAATDAAPVEPQESTPQELALVEDDASQVESTEVVEEVQGQAESTKSWWQSLFAPKEEAATDAVPTEPQQDAPQEEAPQELALVKDDASQLESTEVVEEIQDQAEPTKSWWQSLFEPKEEAVTDAPQQEIAQLADEEPKESAEPSQSWWQAMFSSSEQSDEQPEAPEPEEEHQGVVVIEEVQTEEPQAWWKNLFATKSVGPLVDDESQENESTSQEVAVGQGEQANPTTTKSWWQGMFTSDEKQEVVTSEQETVLVDEANTVADEENVPDVENSDSWWNRVFAEKETPITQTDDLVAASTDEDDSIEIIPEEVEVPQERARENEHVDGLFFVPKVVVAQETPNADKVKPDEPVEADAVAEVEVETTNTMPNIIMEHVKVDTDEAIGTPEQGDPVLKRLYSEPVSWMQSRSAVEAAGTWENDEETFTQQIAQETAVQESIQTQEQQQDLPKGNSQVETQVDTEEDMIIYDTEVLSEQEASS